MTTSKMIRQELLKKIPQSTIYDNMNVIRTKAKQSISKEVALDVVASQNGIDVHSILQKEGKYEELKDFQDAVSKFDFENDNARKKSLITQTKHDVRGEKSPYDIPLVKYNIDSELIRDCKIQKPYRKAIGEALLTLETRIRSQMKLPDSFTGSDLIAETRKKGIFKRTVSAEEQGLFFMFMGAFMWLRNPPSHRKIEYSKEEAVKIILFTDYLLRLFDDLKNKKI